MPIRQKNPLIRERLDETRQVSEGLPIETSRPRISVEGLGEVTQLGAFAFTTSAGLEWSP